MAHRHMFALNGRMNRTQYLLVSIVCGVAIAVMTAFIIFTMDTVLEHVNAKPGPRVIAYAEAEAKAEASDDKSPPPGTEFEAKSEATSGVWLLRSDERSSANPRLMYIYGSQHVVELFVIIAAFGVLIVATSNRFHDMGQSGYFILLLFVPVPLVIWFYLILAPSHDCDPSDDDDDHDDGGHKSRKLKGGFLFSRIVINNTNNNTTD